MPLILSKREAELFHKQLAISDELGQTTIRLIIHNGGFVTHIYYEGLPDAREYNQVHVLRTVKSRVDWVEEFYHTRHEFFQAYNLI